MRGTGLLAMVLTACAGPYDVRFHEDTGEYVVTTVRELPATELGSTGLATLLVFNGAQHDATLVEVRKEAGSPVRALPWLDEADAVFDLGTVDPRPLTPLEQRPLTVRHDPPATTVELAHETRLTLRYSLGERTTELTTTVRARALNFTCGLPATLDFFGVPVGGEDTLTYGFTNTRPVDDVVSFGAPQHVDFSLADGFERQVLAPGAEAQVRLRFAPDALGTVETEVRAQRSSVCPARTVVMRGTGVVRKLGFQAPAPFDAVVGRKHVQLLTVQNNTGRPKRFRASVTGEFFAVGGPAEFELPAATREFQVLRAGEASVLLEFAPTRSGTFSGTVRLETDAPGDTLVVALNGEGT